MAALAPEEVRAGAHWTFLTNHAHVLLCLARDPSARLRDVAVEVGITERATQRIVADLADGGYISRTRVGRRNQYELHPELHLRHPIEADRTLSDLLEMALAGKTGSRKRGKRL